MKLGLKVPKRETTKFTWTKFQKKRKFCPSNIRFRIHGLEGKKQQVPDEVAYPVLSQVINPNVDGQFECSSRFGNYHLWFILSTALGLLPCAEKN